MILVHMIQVFFPYLGKKGEIKTQKEEKPAGKEKPNNLPPSPLPPFLLSSRSGPDPPLVTFYGVYFFNEYADH